MFPRVDFGSIFLQVHESNFKTNICFIIKMSGFGKTRADF